MYRQSNYQTSYLFVMLFILESDWLSYHSAIPTHRGYVKKLKFAPGRGNMKLLVMYNDGCDVWEAKEVSDL